MAERFKFGDRVGWNSEADNVNGSKPLRVHPVGGPRRGNGLAWTARNGVSGQTLETDAIGKHPISL